MFEATDFRMHSALASLLLLSCCWASSVAYSNIGPGTTQNFTDIVRGRCEEYRLCLHGDPCLPSYGQVDCDAAVELFLSAIRNMDPCLTPYDAFDPFLSMVPPTTRRNKAMFWSGVTKSHIPQDISAVTTEYTVLEETYAGYMAGNLSWCGSTDTDSPSGLNFTYCPEWTSVADGCPNNTKATFWGTASRMLARQAAGQVYVVLNAQREGGAFSNGSVFAMIESQNLDPEKVTNVAIYLIPNFDLPTPNDKYRETCENGTVLYMRNLLNSKGLNNTCEEDPTDIMWLQCARYPESPYCLPFSSGTMLTPLGFVAVLVQAVLALIFTSSCAN